MGRRRISLRLGPDQKPLDAYPNYEPPAALAAFAAEWDGLDYDAADNEIFLYHGTNCYRRWEIKRYGSIEAGRSHYSFFCSRPSDAFRYARAACLRDVSPHAVNSLTCEPVVLKVRFNSRTWCQVDFIRDMELDNDSTHLTFAVLGPVSSNAIIDVLHCMHGRRLGASAESIRSFDDGTLLSGIQSLRLKLRRRRPDAWMLKNLHTLAQSVSVGMSGGEMPELTFADNLRRLRQVRA